MLDIMFKKQARLRDIHHQKRAFTVVVCGDELGLAPAAAGDSVPHQPHIF